ncbi:MAG: hypothetical protein IPI49_13025 [Myxococcales bacterium]|nr:hypothetical protein [Myxococcales bacterium]
MATIDPQELELARIRNGQPGQIRNELELTNGDVVTSMNSQLRAIGPRQVQDLLDTFPPSQRAHARLALARSSEFANMEAWNALILAMRPLLDAGGRLYLPGSGSLADNLAYTAQKGAYASLPGGAARLPTTETVTPGAVVVLDAVVLHKLQRDPAFAQTLRDSRCVLLEARGMTSGINLFNSASPEVIARRTTAIMERARALAAERKTSFEEGVDLALEQESRAALQAHAPELAQQLRVVDAATHPALSNADLARQLNGDAGMTAQELEGVLEPFPPEHRALARELLAQQAEIYSPRRLAAELEQQHTTLMAQAPGMGVPPERVYFYIPQTGKSYGMLAMAHREATGTPVERYINGPAELKARNLDKDNLLIVFDDVAGSGQSLEDSTEDVMRTNFHGKIIVSPMVSTKQAKELFTNLSKRNTDIHYQPNKMSMALKESVFHQSLTQPNQDKVNELIGDKGYASNALSLTLPYMAPDNNSSFFGWFLAPFFLANKNQLASKAKPYNFSWLAQRSSP